MLALIIGAQVIATITGSFTCYYLLVTGKSVPGDCSSFGQLTREVWAEALASILALLLAAKEPPPK